MGRGDRRFPHGIGRRTHVAQRNMLGSTLVAISSCRRSSFEKAAAPSSTATSRCDSAPEGHAASPAGQRTKPPALPGSAAAAAAVARRQASQNVCPHPLSVTHASAGALSKQIGHTAGASGRASFGDMGAGVLAPPAIARAWARAASASAKRACAAPTLPPHSASSAPAAAALTPATPHKRDSGASSCCRGVSLLAPSGTRRFSAAALMEPCAKSTAARAAADAAHSVAAGAAGAIKRRGAGGALKAGARGLPHSAHAVALASSWRRVHDAHCHVEGRGAGCAQRVQAREAMQLISVHDAQAQDIALKITPRAGAWYL